MHTISSEHSTANWQYQQHQLLLPYHHSSPLVQSGWLASHLGII